jgi:hypothetical protein
MSEETAKIGSSEWWTKTADKLLGVGMDVLLYKTTAGKGAKGGSETTPGQTPQTSMLEGKLPWILGGIAVIGIGIILWKR